MFVSDVLLDDVMILFGELLVLFGELFGVLLILFGELFCEFFDGEVFIWVFFTDGVCFSGESFFTGDEISEFLLPWISEVLLVELFNCEVLIGDVLIGEQLIGGL